jgi:hypothetical protein
MKLFMPFVQQFLTINKLIAGESKNISNSIKSDLPRAFQQQHPEHSQIPIEFSILIPFSFH